jgi:hypothetical protein
MKKSIYYLFILAISFFSGCKSNEADPSHTLKSFLEALEKKDFKTAKQFATDDSKSLLDILEMGSTLNKEKTESIKGASVSTLKFDEPVISADKATIVVRNKENDQSPITFTLKKINNEWKVAFDKSTLIGMGMEQLNESTKEKSAEMNRALDEIKKIGLDSMQRSIDQEMKKLDTVLESMKDSA